MKKLFFIGLTFGLVPSSFAALKVVTTTPDLGSIASSVGGNLVSVFTIVQGARDPHRIEAKPSYMSRTASADLFIAVGLDLEVGYENAIIEGSRNSKIKPGSARHLHAGDWVSVLEKPSGRIDRSMGDVHPFGNPHVWLDPYYGRVVAARLATEFGKIDAKNAQQYSKNAAAFISRLDEKMFGSTLVSEIGGEKLWNWKLAGSLNRELGSRRSKIAGWTGDMARLDGTEIVTYHRSLSYFTNRFGLKVVDELEPKPGLDPSPGHLTQVIQTMRSTGAKAIVQESFYSSKHAQLISSRTGAKVVIIPQNVGHDSAARDYLSLFDVIVSRLRGI